MVRFKNRWLLLAIDDRPLAAQIPVSQDTSSSAPSRGSGVAATLTPQTITRLLRASLLQNFGDVASGAYSGSLTCKYYSSHTGTAIIRCSREGARYVWAAATLVTSHLETSPEPSFSLGASVLPVTTLRIRVVHCGGTIKKVQTRAIELDRRAIVALGIQRRRIAQAQRSSPAANTSAQKLPNVNAPIAAVPSAIDDDEDLGESLSVAPSPPAPASEASPAPTTSAIPFRKRKDGPQLDADTVAMLAESQKQIKSITS